MKNLLIILLSTSYIFVNAQHPGHCNSKKKEKIKAEKIAFLTAELDLSVKEAQKFWPLYNEYEKKKHELRGNKKCRKIWKKEDISKLQDGEKKEIFEHIKNKDLKQAKLQKEYFEKFAKVLPLEKVLIYIWAEREFTHKLLRRLRHHHKK